MARDDHERTVGTIGTQFQDQKPEPVSLMPRPTTVAEALHLIRGDYRYGHPGLPPKNYKAPREHHR